MPQYVSVQHGDRHRYLVKALHEVSRRIGRLIRSLDEDEFNTRASGDEWSIAQIIGFLRDSEREDYENLAAMMRIDGAPIEERRAMHGPDERCYDADDVSDLYWDFLTLREETIWLLQSAGTAWNHVGTHSYRGEVEVQQYVMEMNERDLDAMWRIQRARDEHRPPGSPQVIGAADV